MLVQARYREGVDPFLSTLDAQRSFYSAQGMAIRPGAAEVLALAKSHFPDAELRRLTLPSDPGDPVVVRLRRPFEWTPNGRTQISVAMDGKVTVEDAAGANRSAWLSEKA
ncbi:MAG: hypothetical protein Q8R02_13910, partial [Hyphomonadaceae bacterium]|nr:hypothetical protein [Hyphomonadaceae bacterium]